MKPDAGNDEGEEGVTVTDDGVSENDVAWEWCDDEEESFITLWEPLCVAVMDRVCMLVESLASESAESVMLLSLCE